MATPFADSLVHRDYLGREFYGQRLLLLPILYDGGHCVFGFQRVKPLGVEALRAWNAANADWVSCAEVLLWLVCTLIGAYAVGGGVHVAAVHYGLTSHASMEVMAICTVILFITSNLLFVAFLLRRRYAARRMAAHDVIRRHAEVDDAVTVEVVAEGDTLFFIYREIIDPSEVSEQ